MLSVTHRYPAMSGTDLENPPLDTAELDLEDGEIEDGDESEEEVVETETVVVNDDNAKADETNSTAANDAAAPGHDTYNGSTKTLQDGAYHEGNEMDDGASPITAEERKKYKKHLRKRKRHKESKEREQEKKERRRKRKMQATEDGLEVDQEHAGSASPHGKKRKKRKKHSKDHKGSTSPDSYDSGDEVKSHSHRRRQRRDSEMADYEYSNEDNPYSTTQSHHFSNTSNNNSGTYYSPAYTNEGNYDSNSESGSDYEAQLAEYRNYKTKKSHGEDDSDEYYDEQYYQSKDYHKKGHSFDGMQKGQRSKRSRWETSGEPPRKGRRDDGLYQYDEGYSDRRVCKFFAEGHCLKGDDCTFIHDYDTQRTGYRSKFSHGRGRRRELCKYYLAGHCHHGDSCTYMHGEYPCKYFHTGVTCFSGDNCRFSHDPPTEETQEIVDNLKDIYSSVDDSWEISELAKVGVTPHSKPLPGVGLLPTPTFAPAPDSSQSVIPSLFDIKVEPTADFQRRIDEKQDVSASLEEKITRRIREIDTACALLQLSSIASLSVTDESEGVPDGVPSIKPMYQQQYSNQNTLPPNAGGLLPTPTSIPPSSQGNSQQETSDGFYDNFYEGDHRIGNADDKDRATNGQTKKAKPDNDIIQTDSEDFIRIDNTTTTEDEHSDVAPDVKAPDFLPATQKALFMRIHQKRPSHESDKGDNSNDGKGKTSDNWTYSSDDEDKPPPDGGIIKMDTDMPAATPTTAAITTASVESILKMITDKQGDITNVDTNLLSKVASVINMATASASASDHYNPASSTATYNPAQVKASPRHSSQSHHRERKSSGSSSTSPGHSSGKHHHHQPNPIRRRLSTQELTKEPTIIPLVTKQSGGTMHASHPDPRLTLSRLLGVKLPTYSASLPRFSKDLILPGSGKMVGLKITLSSEDSKTSKRDPRLGRRKDPRLQKSGDPRLKSKNAVKISSPVSSVDSTSRSSVPEKPSALLTKTSAVIPSLPELDLDLAHVNNQTKESSRLTPSKSPPSAKPSASYSLPPNLKLPRLMKAPTSSPTRDKDQGSSEEIQSAPPTIAPYDPRYIASGPANSGSGPSMSTAPYDPRVLSSQSALSTGESKKRTIQLPKLTPAPSYKPNEDVANGSGPAIEEMPEGDQGDF